MSGLTMGVAALLEVGAVAGEWLHLCHVMSGLTMGAAALLEVAAVAGEWLHSCRMQCLA